ncbi:MAG TPA: MoaD/ThiS family protein [Actinomycetales bacterium]|nr:MoaD/ThiS family protein [Actinomycetales bacterium]
MGPEQKESDVDSVTIRWFAGAREAAGATETVVERREGATARSVLAEASAGNERLGRVIEVSSLLADGSALTDRGAPLAARTLDVLPPFAGG